jgi:hypothetical protein
MKIDAPGGGAGGAAGRRGGAERPAGRLLTAARGDIDDLPARRQA